jgi:hypothetical protein
MLSHVYLLTKVRRRPLSKVLERAQKDASSSHVATHDGFEVQEAADGRVRQ